jgi:hypothetical protein
MGKLYWVPTADFVQKTLNAELLAGATAAATLNNVTSVPNLAGIMIIDRVDANGNETPTKVEVISFEGTSGSTVTTLVRGLAGTTDQVHAVGAVVEFGPDVVWAQAILDALGQVVDTSTGLVDYTAKVMKPTAPYVAVGSDATGDLYYRGTGGTLSRLALGVENQVLTANASLPYWATASGGGGGGTAFWSALPTTPTWTATNQISIDDASNAGAYDKLFSKGTLFKWDDGAFKTAMSAGASYASDKVYIGLLGSTLSTLASLPTFKYSIPTLEDVQETFIIPGTLPSTATTNITKQVFTKSNRYYLGADFIVAAGGSGATLTSIDFNDDSVSLFPAGATLHNWLPTLATTSLNIAFLNPETAVAAGSKLTVDVDSTNSTAQTDGYLYVYSFPEGWRYRS